jgi:predicted PurR-regulated permease PerM
VTPRPPQTRHPIPGWPIAATLAVLFLFLYYVREVLLPFVVAAALAFVLTPLVDHLHRRVGPAPRWLAALAVYLVVMALLGVFAWQLGPLIVADLSGVLGQLPQSLHALIAALAGKDGIPLLGQAVDPDALTQEIVERLRGILLSGSAAYAASLGIAAVFGFFLSFVLLLYFLISGQRLSAGALWLVPPEHRAEVRAAAIKVGPVLRRYFVGLVVVVAYTATVAWIAFAWVFSLPHAPLLAVSIGILELIPIIGPLTSIGLIALTALQGGSLWLAIGLGAFALALRLSIDQLVGPLVLGRAAYLHPVVIIFAFLSGAVFLGILGLILAVPVAATIRIVLTHYYAERVVEEES